MGRVAVFVDAGYFWVQACKAVLGRAGSRNEISIDYSLLRTSLLGEVKTQVGNAELLRVYWYDGPGQSGKGPDHQSIEYLDDFKLRLGTRNMTGQQKAVDGLIIADMLNLTQSKAIDHAVLFSGDADLTPGVTAAQAMGLRVHIAVLEPRQATSPYLAAEADGKLFLSASWVNGFAKVSVSALPGAAKPLVQNVASDPSAPSTATAATPTAPPRLSFDAVAQKVHASVLGGPLAPLMATVSKGPSYLPKEIDSQLLYEGKVEAGGALTEDEKRLLRSGFKNLA